jgi:methionyl-tRNA formyltransferase
MSTRTTDKLIFFGTDAFSVPSLVRLIAEKWNIITVITKPDSKMGRGQELSAPAVKKLAQAAGIPVLQPSKLSEIEGEFRNLAPDAGIVVAYGKIIQPQILEIFPKGLINVHPSLLPRFRGASPIESTILAGDEQTGVTLMQLDRAVDSGPTYDIAKLQLGGTETRPELYERLAEMGAERLAAKLPSILDGTIVPIPQDTSKVTHSKMLKKSDGRIDWNKNASELEREVRAYLGWPGSAAQIAGIEVIITASHVSPKDGPSGTAYVSPSQELAVYASTGTLIIDRLKPAGKREMTGMEFLSGHPLSQ